MNNARPLAISEGLTRTWVSAYTAATPSGVRVSRRAEIDSDLWEHEQAALAAQQGSLSTAREVLGRLLRGVPDDLMWRLRMGGFEMQSRFVIERTTGVAMLLIVLLAVAAIGLGPGISGSEPYFTYDFPSFTRQLDGHALQLVFQFAFAAAMIPAAALLYLTFRPHVGRFAILGAITLLASAALMTAAAVASVRLHTLADVWNDGGARGDAVWLSARSAAGLVEGLSIAGVLAFVASFATFGVMIARSTPLPRALGLATLAGGGLMVLALVGMGAAGGDGFWFVLMLGMLAVLLSIVVTGGWLVVRGTRPAPGSASGAN